MKTATLLLWVIAGLLATTAAMAADTPEVWLGLIVEEGERHVEVVRAVKSGPAEKAGIQSGDVLGANSRAQDYDIQGPP
jgi:predicted metalloprotease with PDZ domain